MNYRQGPPLVGTQGRAICQDFGCRWAVAFCAVAALSRLGLGFRFFSLAPSAQPPWRRGGVQDALAGRLRGVGSSPQAWETDWAQPYTSRLEAKDWSGRWVRDTLLPPLCRGPLIRAFLWSPG